MASTRSKLLNHLQISYTESSIDSNNIIDIADYPEDVLLQECLSICKTLSLSDQHNQHNQHQQTQQSYKFLFWSLQTITEIIPLTSIPYSRLFSLFAPIFASFHSLFWRNSDTLTPDFLFNLPQRTSHTEHILAQLSIKYFKFIFEKIALISDYSTQYNLFNSLIQSMTPRLAWWWIDSENLHEPIPTFASENLPIVKLPRPSQPELIYPSAGLIFPSYPLENPDSTHQIMSSHTIWSRISYISLWDLTFKSLFRTNFMSNIQSLDPTTHSISIKALSQSLRRILFALSRNMEIPQIFNTLAGVFQKVDSRTMLEEKIQDMRADSLLHGDPVRPNKGRTRKPQYTADQQEFFVSRRELVSTWYIHSVPLFQSLFSQLFLFGTVKISDHSLLWNDLLSNPTTSDTITPKTVHMTSTVASWLLVLFWNSVAIFQRPNALLNKEAHAISHPLTFIAPFTSDVSDTSEATPINGYTETLFSSPAPGPQVSFMGFSIHNLDIDIFTAKNKHKSDAFLPISPVYTAPLGGISEYFVDSEFKCFQFNDSTLSAHALANIPLFLAAFYNVSTEDTWSPYLKSKIDTTSNPFDTFLLHKHIIPYSNPKIWFNHKILGFFLSNILQIFFCTVEQSISNTAERKKALSKKDPVLSFHQFSPLFLCDTSATEHDIPNISHVQDFYESNPFYIMTQNRETIPTLSSKPLEQTLYNKNTNTESSVPSPVRVCYMPIKIPTKAQRNVASHQYIKTTQQKAQYDALIKHGYSNTAALKKLISSGVISIPKPESKELPPTSPEYYYRLFRQSYKSWLLDHIPSPDEIVRAASKSLFLELVGISWILQTLCTFESLNSHNTNTKLNKILSPVSSIFTVPNTPLSLQFPISIYHACSLPSVNVLSVSKIKIPQRHFLPISSFHSFIYKCWSRILFILSSSPVDFLVLSGIFATHSFIFSIPPGIPEVLDQPTNNETSGSTNTDNSNNSDNSDTNISRYKTRKGLDYTFLSLWPKVLTTMKPLVQTTELSTTLFPASCCITDGFARAITSAYLSLKPLFPPLQNQPPHQPHQKLHKLVAMKPTQCIPYKGVNSIEKSRNSLWPYPVPYQILADIVHNPLLSAIPQAQTNKYTLISPPKSNHFNWNSNSNPKSNVIRGLHPIVSGINNSSKSFNYISVNPHISIPVRELVSFIFKTFHTLSLTVNVILQRHYSTFLTKLFLLGGSHILPLASHFVESLLRILSGSTYDDPVVSLRCCESLVVLSWGCSDALWSHRFVIFQTIITKLFTHKTKINSKFAQFYSENTTKGNHTHPSNTENEDAMSFTFDWVLTQNLENVTVSLLKAIKHVCESKGDLEGFNHMVSTLRGKSCVENIVSML